MTQIVTDQGQQFESFLFQEFTKLLRIKKVRTTSYHSQSNGLIKRIHRTLKTAIKAYKNKNCVNVLPTGLLELRTTFKEDLGASVAELVYGCTLKR